MTSRATVPPDRLEDLDPSPVAGTTHMRRAHLNGLRRSVARCKAWFKPEVNCETALKAAFLTYLKEWEAVYGEGSIVLGLNQTERTIMVIRQDTIQQIMREFG